MRAWLLVIVLAAGCAGDDADPCGYHEAADGTNATTPEPTGLVVGPGAPSLCGNLEGGHFDPQTSELDRDRYDVEVGGSGEVLVQLSVEQGVELLDEVDLRLFSAGTPPVLVAQGALRPELAGHLAYVATVPPGETEVVVAARSSSDVIGELAYRARLWADPSASCPAAHGTPRYREAHDGGDATGNDVVTADFSMNSPLAMIGGHPEPTDLTIGGGQHYLIAGSAGARPGPDRYLDRDTYALRTGEYVNELAVRVDWDSAAGADLDLVVLDPDTLAPVVTSTRSGTTGPEYQVFAVRPDAPYWLWVGRYAAAGTTPAPVDYRITICGGNFY